MNFNSSKPTNIDIDFAASPLCARCLRLSKSFAIKPSLYLHNAPTLPMKLSLSAVLGTRKRWWVFTDGTISVTNKAKRCFLRPLSSRKSCEKSNLVKGFNFPTVLSFSDDVKLSMASSFSQPLNWKFHSWVNNLAALHSTMHVPIEDMLWVSRSEEKR